MTHLVHDMHAPGFGAAWVHSQHDDAVESHVIGLRRLVDLLSSLQHSRNTAVALAQ